MKFHDDMSFIDQNAVNRGLAHIIPFQIHLDRYFTEEEKSANKAYAESHSSEEWSAHCDAAREKIAAENLALMDFLEKYFTFRRLSGKDYSYITLSLDKKGDEKEKERIFAKVKELLADYPAKNIQAIFQYSQVENTDFVKEEAERIFKECEDKFVNYNGMIGKLERYNGEYLFKKKYAKAYGYRVSPMNICTSVNI